jgi:rare lipoprotein A (peptidoglycan hydrolase)
MTYALAQRELALVGAALLAAVVALALGARDDDAPAASALPRPAAADAANWYPALAGVRTRRLAGAPSACGYALAPTTLGVEHPVLPCGVKVYLRYEDKTVLTQVLDRGPSAAGREFDLTPALAERLGVRGVQPVRWTYARYSARGPGPARERRNFVVEPTKSEGARVGQGASET